MTKDVLRSAVAAVTGIAVAFGLIWLAQYAGNEISPAEYNLDTDEILIPIGSTIALVVGWFIGTFAGGWLAMRVSTGTGAGWIVAGSVIGAALYRAVTLADTWWIMALGVAVPLAAVWLAQRATRIIAY
ncbi:MAG TPA: hypothetical protein VGN68_13705 [Sphingopyxis sp.]|jgi:hypothetical protein|uniref:hypothetical protein n=1 Tax=Sphingopyxis sp. TaxID=1908224 RepID=UPI002E15A86C|nr:hypothetical protein [Sphingopyxis sp.]